MSTLPRRLGQLGKAPVAAAWIAFCLVAAGCSGPSASTAAGQAEMAGQQCTLCRARNPGDIAPCCAVCMRRIQDQQTYEKASGH